MAEDSVMGFESYLMSVIESLKTLRKTEAAEKTFSAASALFSDFSGSVASVPFNVSVVQRPQRFHFSSKQNANNLTLAFSCNFIPTILKVMGEQASIELLLHCSQS